MKEPVMRTRTLSADEVLRGYDEVAQLYPHVPSLSHWRAWEYAAYRHFQINDPVLDLGCGDGRYFRLIWPRIKEVVGVDNEPQVAELGRQSGVYLRTHVTPAHEVPEPDGSFAHVFANCSLEHMNHLDKVLAEIHRCLKPGGTLLCSVVTDRFVKWPLLPHFTAAAGFAGAASVLKGDFLRYHCLANPLPVAEWVQAFSRAGLTAEEHVPILPLYNGGAFLLMDNLWHVKRAAGGEMGDDIYPFLSKNPAFPAAFRKIFEGLLEMEMDWLDCCGAVFLARKAG
jgi:SAM-dependent methyltransferase